MQRADSRSAILRIHLAARLSYTAIMARTVVLGGYTFANFSLNTEPAHACIVGKKSEHAHTIHSTHACSQRNSSTSECRPKRLN